jgi:hypothetical protein
MPAHPSDLSGLFTLRHAQTRSITAENPGGEPGAGGQAAPEPMFDGTPSPARDLGPGWKCRPFVSIMPGEIATIANIEGSGIIRHIWMTTREKAYRSCVLRMYWDGEDTPSVEAPLGDFFCNGHALRTQVSSIPVAVNPVGGFNSYWPMPFSSGARITVTSDHHEPIRTLFYQIDYSLEPVPDDAGRFHAQWRRSTTCDRPEHTIVDGIEGEGHYVGTYLAWAALSNGWWGEGEVKFFLDGDTDHPTLCGTGTEDYVGGAWCFSEAGERERPYSTPYLGLPLVRQEPGEVPVYGMYRWHIPDPIHFQKRLRATVQALGWWPGHRYEPRADDIASVAYWYQREPHGAFPDLPGHDARLPR